MSNETESNSERPEAVGKPHWHAEFERLPPWAQKMVRGLAGCAGYGGGGDRTMLPSLTDSEDYSIFNIFLHKNGSESWWDGFFEMKSLAEAMTAPWPAPMPAPRESITVVNAVEMIADSEDCAFDQPCHYGHRVESHAVYCHNESWPDSPRKCRRDREDFRHEDCPGFAPNAQFQEHLPTASGNVE